MSRADATDPHDIDQMSQSGSSWNGRSIADDGGDWSEERPQTKRERQVDKTIRHLRAFAWQEAHRLVLRGLREDAMARDINGEITRLAEKYVWRLDSDDRALAMVQFRAMVWRQIDYLRAPKR
jgi:hypothetical protein